MRFVDARGIMELKGKRILITGGAGLIGSHIADQLSVLDPAEIIIFDNFVRGPRGKIRELLEESRVTVIEGDIRDRDALACAMRSVDVLLHAWVFVTTSIVGLVCLA